MLPEGERMMLGEEINATVRREPHRVVVSIAETDWAKAGIAGLICELDATSAPSMVPTPSSPPLPQPESDSLVALGLEEELEKELEHRRELYREKREYVRQLELEEARRGISFPTDKQLELKRSRQELNDLMTKIWDLAPLLADDRRLPYATG
jgi:hypothetical protein